MCVAMVTDRLEDSVNVSDVCLTHCTAFVLTEIDVSLVTAVCSSGCYNGGTCVSPNTCSCASGWMGVDCRTGECMKWFYLVGSVINERAWG